MVDLVGEPGNLHGPDSSINGGTLSSIPSPFQISHLKESKQPYRDSELYCQITNSKRTGAPPEDPFHAGMFCSLENTCSNYFGVLEIEGNLNELQGRGIVIATMIIIFV